VTGATMTCHGDLGDEVCSPSRGRRAVDDDMACRQLPAGHGIAVGVLRFGVRAAPEARHVLGLKRLDDVILGAGFQASVLPAKG
jgi:hypothetical protein